MWKPIIGYEGLYEISDMGDVRNMKGHVKKKQVDKDGYYKVWLSKQSKKKPYFIHRLVALHFVPNPNNKPVTNHKDGNKKNNYKGNLEWATRSENDKHAFKLGLRKPTCGGTSKKVLQFTVDGKFVKSYNSLSHAARAIGCTVQNISYCANGHMLTAYGYIWRFAKEGVTTSRKA